MQNNLNFSGRATLQKETVCGWYNHYGPSYLYWSQYIPVSGGLPDPGYQLSGFHIHGDLDVYGVRFKARQSSSNSNCKWKLHVVSQSVDDGTKSVTNRFIYSDANWRQHDDTDVHMIDIPIDDFVYSGETLSLMFERGSGGANRYYLYIPTGVILLR